MHESTRALLQRLAESPQQLVRRYPIRNQAWSFDEKTGYFAADASDLGLVRLDPWNRPIPDANVVPLRDHENDVYAWQCTTTISGESVILMIFND